jgi:hypothetical protein
MSSTIPQVELPAWVQGARNPSPLITWLQNGTTTPQDLTGATLTGVIWVSRSEAAAITGTLTLTDADAGQFRWDLSADDVDHTGVVTVQFTATYASGVTPAVSFEATWEFAAKRVATS